jgi:hypothetical protein
MAAAPKEGRKAALRRIRSRLEKRSFGNDLWQVVLQYAYGESNLQNSRPRYRLGARLYLGTGAGRGLSDFYLGGNLGFDLPGG